MFVCLSVCTEKNDRYVFTCSEAYYKVKKVFEITRRKKIRPTFFKKPLEA